jgi:hypothetical protein
MRKLILIHIVTILFLILPVKGQNDTIDSPLTAIDTLSQDFGLFTKDDILDVTMRFDITNYQRKKPKDEYMPATLTYYLSDKDSIYKEISLRSRGIMRHGYCSFPPIQLNFKKQGSQDNDTEEIEKIKMVTHCMSGNEDYLIKEYLIYKLYNVLTDLSYRVRFIRVEYINTYKRSKPINTYAFLIEPTEMLTGRTNSVEEKSPDLSRRSIIRESLDRVAIFNYMIGNTDWSVRGQHNCKILLPPDVIRPYPGMIVPYDFDYAGLVDADYAVPAEKLGLKSVRERHYDGMCRSEDDIINALREFTEKKEEFYRVINEFPLINDKEKKEMIGYLDSFYNRFDKRNSIVTDILRDCVGY